jgi:hypothetical protein
MTARRLLLAARLQGRDSLINRGDDGRLGPLLFRSQRTRLAATLGIARIFGADGEAVNEMPRVLPAMLDRVDGWIESGVLGGDQLNAADFMIVTSWALLTYRRDLRPELEGRPAMRLVDRLLPEPGLTPDSAPSARLSAG